MAADIGAKIGIDGEKSFRDSLAAINSQMRSLSSEMKAVVSAFAGMEDSEEAVAAKGDVLQRSIETSVQKMKTLQSQSERAKNRLSELAKELDAAQREFGANSEQAMKAQNAYNRQVVAVNKLETQINTTRAEMNRMEKEMRDMGKAADDMGDDLKQAGKNADEAGNSFRDAFLGGAMAGAVQSMVSGIASLVENTEEYRKIMGTLDTSSEKAGYSAEQTAETYNQLYGVLGDNRATATAAANLQALGLSQDKLKKMTDGAIGAWATYGDSIPIDGLAEAINETVQAGKVTGTFADVLNWAGTSEDAFNAKLEVAGSQAERANIVLEELANQGLMDTAEAWRVNNAEIVAANEASANLEATTARLGTMLSPIVTNLKEGLNAILSTLLDLVAEGNPSVSMITGISAALAMMGLATFITQGTVAIDMINKMKTAFTALSVAMKANPIMLVVSLLAGLVAALVTAYQTNDEFRSRVDTAWATLRNGVGEKVAAVKSLVDGLKNKFVAFITWLKNIPGEMKSLGSNIISGLWNGINGNLQWLKNKVRAAVASIKKLFTGITGFDTHSPSKWSDGVAKNVLQGIGNRFDKDKTAEIAVSDAIGRMKASMQTSMNALSNNMATATMTPRMAMAGGVTNTYTYGDFHLHVGTVNNGNGRDVERLARELDFSLRQKAAGKGDSV